MKIFQIADVKYPIVYLSIFVIHGTNKFQKARITLIAFPHGLENPTGSIEVKDTLLRSLIVMDLDCILQQNEPQDCILEFKYKAWRECHDINCLWEKCSVFERDQKHKYVRVNN